MYLKLKSATKVLTGERNNGKQSNKDSQYLWCCVTIMIPLDTQQAPKEGNMK